MTTCTENVRTDLTLLSHIRPMINSRLSCALDKHYNSHHCIYFAEFKVSLDPSEKRNIKKVTGRGKFL